MIQRILTCIYSVAISDFFSREGSGVSSLSVNYPETLVAFFTLKSRYYACTALGRPVACTITIAGFKQSTSDANADPVCSAKLVYQPSTSNGPAEMMSSPSVNLAGCIEDVYYAQFSASSTQAQADDLALYLDTIEYTAYRNC
jgi:hypothetical protein